MQGKLSWTIDMEAGPIYVQIGQNVRRLIAREDLRPGDKLPSARELAQVLGVNPNTVVHAYSRLEFEGIIETRRGLGTFIRLDAPVQMTKKEMLKKAAQRYAAEVRALDVSQEEAISMLKEVLDVGTTS
ncbi:GntR family transcriptional regulator [Candidatus Bipolaricaulota bacterium]|nr:GntR family transcriptional regulator [Candidatus Bipolaricaulota bacterium]